MKRVTIAPPKGQKEMLNYKGWLEKRNIDFYVLEKIDNLKQNDILMLCGGSDVGENIERDAFEIRLIKQALKQNNPIVGICRGLQIVNVLLGGSLIKHIITNMIHESYCPENGKRESNFHKVNLNNGDSFMVNSRHNQAIDEIGNGLKIDALSNDGIVEMVSMNNVLLVQWHPELEDVYDWECEKLVSNWIKEKQN